MKRWTEDVMPWSLLGKKKKKKPLIQNVNVPRQDVKYECPVCEFGDVMTLDRIDAAHVIKCERCGSIYVLALEFELKTDKFCIDEPWKGMMGKVKDKYKGRLFFHFDPSGYIEGPEDQ